MKTSRCLLFLLSLFLVLAAAACGSSDSSQSPEPDDVFYASEDVFEYTVSLTDEIEIIIVFPWNISAEEFLSRYGLYEVYKEFDDEFFPPLILMTNTPIKNFSWLSLEHEVREDYNFFFVENILHTINEFLPETPFAVSWPQIGFTPVRGISFIDENDVLRYFVLHESGYDGSILLTDLDVLNLR